MRTFLYLLHRTALTLAITLFAYSAVAHASGGVQSKTTSVYGMKIHYLEAGKGPTVILLHGLGADTSIWAPTIGPLSKKHRVIVLDQIGFGKSDKPLINYRVGTLVDFLDGFYKKLKIERATLVGNSLGGFAAAAFTLAHPQKVDRLVLVASAGFALPKGTDPRAFYALNPSTHEGMKQVIQSVFYDKQLFATDANTDAFFAKKNSRRVMATLFRNSLIQSCRAKTCLMASSMQSSNRHL